MRPMVGLVLVAAMAGCSVPPGDPYPLPSGPGSRMTAPAAIGRETHAVVLFLTPRPGDRLQLVAAEPIGVAAGAEVRFFFSPPVRTPTGERVVGEDLRELAGATFAKATGIEGPDSTVGIVAEITAHEPGRYQLTGVRLRYRLNGGDERVGEGVATTFTVCADDPAPASCDD